MGAVISAAEIAACRLRFRPLSHGRRITRRNEIMPSTAPAQDRATMKGVRIRKFRPSVPKAPTKLRNTPTSPAISRVLRAAAQVIGSVDEARTAASGGWRRGAVIRRIRLCASKPPPPDRPGDAAAVRRRSIRR
jgi:hypothetical protein